MHGGESLLRRALDALDDVFYVYDESARLVVWNSRLRELFGLTDEELQGMQAELFFVEDDREAVRVAVAEAMETGETVVQARAETAEGTILFELSGRALYDEDGTFRGFSGIGRDVTDQREREWRLARQNERLDEFADVLAHDLRNPLSITQGYLELVRQEYDPPDLAEAAAGLARIEDIVTDVLTAARQGTEVTDPEPVPLASVARRAWNTTDTGSARLVVRSERVLEADEDRLRRLLENCFRNAVEHGSSNSPSHTRESAVEDGSGDGASQAQSDGSGGNRPLVVTVADTARGFVVSDDGVGFGDIDPAQVFEPGYTSSPDGTGLGLSIVRSLVDAHGWTVTAEEGPDGGASFVFDVFPHSDPGEAELGV